MNIEANNKANNWMNSWWFKSIIIGVFILIGIVDVVYWKSKVLSAMWTVIKTLLTEKAGWQFIVLLALFMFRQQIGVFLASAGNALGRIRKLSIGEKFSFSSDEVASALVDREVLKVSIRVAMAYDGIDRNEQIYLLNRASPMKNHVQNLEDAEKWQVIEEAINIALMDNEIQNPEYLIIQDVAVKLYELDKDKLDELIMKECFARKGAIPPAILKEQFNWKYGKLKK